MGLPRESSRRVCARTVNCITGAIRGMWTVSPNHATDWSNCASREPSYTFLPSKNVYHGVAISNPVSLGLDQIVLDRGTRLALGYTAPAAPPESSLIVGNSAVTVSRLLRNTSAPLSWAIRR